MAEHNAMALVSLAATLSFPGISWLANSQQGGHNAHPLLSLLIVVAILGFVFWGFQRRSS